MTTRRDPGREAAARALDIVGQVQVFGLASAAAVAERYIDTVDRYLARRVTTDAGPRQLPDDGTSTQALVWMEQAVRRSLDLLSTGVRADLVPPGPARDVPRPQGVRGSEVLQLPPVLAGGSSEASVWVHNPTVAAVAVVVRLSSPTSADGHALPAEAVSVAPELVAAVPPGGSAEVRVRVMVPAGTPPGHFHALVTSTATPRQALVAQLEVRAGGGQR